MAANTGIIDGGDILVYYNAGTDLAPDWQPILHDTECTIQHSVEVRKRMTKDTGKSSQKRTGEHTTTISCSSLTTYDGDFGYFAIRALMLDGTPIKLKYSGRPAADVTAGNAELAEQVGDSYEEGLFIITALERTDAKNTDSTMKATFENSGLPEVKTVAAP